MKTLKISLMALALTITGAAAYAQTADEIINKHIDAIGGTKNWDKIKTVKMTGTVSAQGMEIPVTQTIVNDKGMRTDISAMGQNGYMILTVNGGWQYMPFAGQTAPKEIPAEDLKGIKGQLSYKNSVLADKSMIKDATLDGTDTIDNQACYKVKITNKEGNTMVCYFDTKTFYMVRAEMKMDVKGEEQEMTTNYSNFKKQPEGVVVPMVVGSMMGDMTIKTIELNKPVDDKIFKPDTK